VFHARLDRLIGYQDDVRRHLVDAITLFTVPVVLGGPAVE
jgi:hypothetical protein